MWTVEVRPAKGDVKGAVLKRVIAEDLDIRVRSVETSDVYYGEGACSEDEKSAIMLLLHDAVAQSASTKLREAEGWLVEVRYKPGVTDPAEQSIRKALDDAGMGCVRRVSAAQRYAMQGDVDEKKVRMIAEGLLANAFTQEYFIGKGRLETPEPKDVRSGTAGRIRTIRLRECSATQLMDISRKHLLSLNLGEMKAIQAYFSGEGRDPTDAELETLAQTWSEHCKHKTLNSEIEYHEEDRTERILNLFRETIVAATEEIAKRKDWLVSVFRDNAGVIAFDDEYHLAFKVETHNHPSALDPYGGAGTGIGGVIRDVLGAGLGAKPVCSMDVFCVGMPDEKSVPEKIIHPKRLLKGVVAGVRDYGNRMGIPTVNGAVHFHPDYLGAPLVFCGTAGLLPKGMEEKEAKKGDAIVVIGGKTGRDGIHGATFSSAVLDEKSPASAVQIGNAIEEKRMMDAVLAARDERLYNCITDCGAGGFGSAVGEMAEALGCEVQLENVPLKYAGMQPWEIWLSESQERMVVAVPEKNLARLEEICSRERTDMAVIGRFTGTKRLVVTHRGGQLIDVDMAFLHQGMPKSVKKAVWKQAMREEPTLQAQDCTEALRKVLAHPTIASKEWVIRQYDHEVQGASVIKPLVGAENDGPGDAAMLRPGRSDRGLIIANGGNPRYGEIDAYWMSLAAIDEALRNVVCVGGDIRRTALLDNFCWGAISEEKLGSLVRAAKACREGALAFGAPFISGKDSLHNEFVANGTRITIPDTLLISAVSVSDVKRAVTMDAKEAGNSIYVVGVTRDELGGSIYYALHGAVGANVPRVNLKTAPGIMEKLADAIGKGLVRSCHDCSEGGLAVAAAEMSFAGDRGMTMDAEKVPCAGNLTTASMLFSETPTRFIVEVQPQHEAAFAQLLGNDTAKIGAITAEKSFIVRKNGSAVIDASIAELKAAWQETLRW